MLRNGEEDWSDYRVEETNEEKAYPCWSERYWVLELWS